MATSGLTEAFSKKLIETSRNTTMGHLNIRRQGLQSNKDKPPDTYLEYIIKSKVVF